MVTYQDLYYLDLGRLRSAASRFDDFLQYLKRLKADYATAVQQPMRSAQWVQSWGNYHVTAYRLADEVAGELEDALVEAEAIRDVLEQAGQELKRHKAELHRLAHEEAPARKLRVSDRGRVTPTHDLTDYEPDGDVENVMARARAEVLEMERRIEEVLTAAAQVDETAAAALRRSAGGDDAYGFNDRTVSMDDVRDEREARQAADLLEKADGDLGRLSPTELATLERLMRDNQHSTAFNRTLLDSLGPEATLGLANNLAELREAGDPHGTYASLERALANGIGAATLDERFRSSWFREMERLGTEVVPGSARRGYQVLAGLLEEGEGYSYPFLSQLTDMMIRADRDNPDMWDSNYFTGEDVPEVDDPIDRMLGIMGRHPDVATRYFTDPSGGEWRLDYLLEERDWPTANCLSHRDNVVTAENDPPNSRAGLGLALEAAVRGEPAGAEVDCGDHTSAQQQVMDHLIEHYGGDTVEGVPVPPAMRVPLGRALADYTPDTHQILTGDYASQDTNPHQLIRFMRGVAEDPEAYAKMQELETAHITETITDAAGSPDALATAAREGGEVQGVYDEIRADVLEDQAEDSNRWNDEMFKHLVSEPVEHLPHLGGLAADILDVYLSDMAEQARTEAATEVAENCLASERQITLLVEEWARAEGLDPDSPELRDVKHQAQGARFDGKERAAEALGR